MFRALLVKRLINPGKVFELTLPLELKNAGIFVSLIIPE